MAQVKNPIDPTRTVGQATATQIEQDIAESLRQRSLTPTEPEPGRSLDSTMTGTQPTTPNLQSAPDSFTNLKSILKEIVARNTQQNVSAQDILRNAKEQGLATTAGSALGSMAAQESIFKASGVTGLYNSTLDLINEQQKLNQQKQQQGLALFNLVAQNDSLRPLLAQLKPDEISSWVTNGEIPPNLSAVLPEVIKSLPDESLKPTADITEYKFAQDQGYTGSFMDWVDRNKKGTGTGGTKISLADAVKYGLPFSTVGLTEQQVGLDLSLPKPPQWFLQEETEKEQEAGLFSIPPTNEELTRRWKIKQTEVANSANKESTYMNAENTVVVNLEDGYSINDNPDNIPKLVNDIRAATQLPITDIERMVQSQGFIKDSFTGSWFSNK